MAVGGHADIGNIEIDSLEDADSSFKNNDISATVIKPESRDYHQLIKSLDCEICSKHFTNLHNQEHLVIHEKFCSCYNCEKKFHSKTLDQHDANHFTKRSYCCEFCEKSFNRMSTLISHRKTHDDSKLFACPLCEKRFHQKGNLRNHIYTHANLRPYKCNYCGKGFNQMSNLVCHKKKKHSDKVIDPWICTICENKFAKRIDLRSHKLEVHRIEIDLDKPIEKLYSRKNASFVLQDSDFDTLLQTERQEPIDLVPETSIAFGKNEIAAPSSIIIKSIQTEAMITAKQKNEVPFAVLHFLHGQPILVRCIEIIGEDKTMLRPTNQEDIQILNKYKDSENNGYIPIVARIYQTSSSTGDSVFEIKSPKNIYLFPNSEQNAVEQNNFSSMHNDRDITKSDYKNSSKITARDCDYESKTTECNENYERLIESNEDENQAKAIPQSIDDEQLKYKPPFVPVNMNLIDTKSPLSDVENIDSLFTNNQLIQDSGVLNQNDETDINLLKNFLLRNFHECEEFNDIIAELEG